MQEVRCAKCKRKLAVGLFLQLEIKCPRCGALNIVRAQSPDLSAPEHLPQLREKGSSMSITSEKPE